jgi:hypothetical protein
MSCQLYYDGPRLMILKLSAEDQSKAFPPALSRFEDICLKWIRLPILVAIVLNIVGSIKSVIALVKVAAIILVAVYLYLAVVVLFYTFVKQNHFSSKRARHALILTLAALPFLAIRVAYLVLGSFQVDGMMFSSILGSIAAAWGMQLSMEVIIILLFISTRIVLLHSVGKRVEQSDILL